MCLAPRLAPPRAEDCFSFKRLNREKAPQRCSPRTPTNPGSKEKQQESLRVDGVKDTHSTGSTPSHHSLQEEKRMLMSTPAEGRLMKDAWRLRGASRASVDDQGKLTLSNSNQSRHQPRRFLQGRDGGFSAKSGKDGAKLRNGPQLHSRATACHAEGRRLKHWSLQLQRPHLQTLESFCHSE